jgi:hypothetical protein
MKTLLTLFWALFVINASAAITLPVAPSAVAGENIRGKRLVIIGDSLSSNDYDSWAYYLRDRSNYNGIVILTNASIGGDTVSNMVQRFAADILPFAPNTTGQPATLAVFGGINDRDRDSAETIWLNVSNLWSRGAAGGFDVMGFTLSGVAAPATNTQSKIEAVNDLIRVGSTNLYRLIDAGALLGNALATNIFTDGIHYQPGIDLKLAKYVEWAMALGNGFAPAFAPPWDARVRYNYGEATNLALLGGQRITGSTSGIDDTSIGIGYQTTATNYGTTIGRQTVAYDLSTGIGQTATGTVSSIAIGFGANATNFGTAIGRGARATNALAAGYGAIASDISVSIGASSAAHTYGAAVGSSSLGSTYGSAFAYGSKGWSYGAAFGYNSEATNRGAAFGFSSIASGIGSVAIGASAVIPAGWSNTVTLGSGTATMRGGLNFRGVGILTTNFNFVLPNATNVPLSADVGVSGVWIRNSNGTLWVTTSNATGFSHKPL